MKETPIAVFLRPPIPGRTKTRLARSVGVERAAALYEAFVRDGLCTIASRPGLRAELWVAGDPDHPFVASLPAELPRRRQRADGLGARMAEALARLIEESGRGLVVGTDTPSLPAGLLDAAVRALDDHDLVLGPSADGGYYLVGAARCVPEVFDGIRFSTPHCLRDTVTKAGESGVTTALLSPWFDVDTGPDLALLRAHLAVDSAAAPATRAILCGKPMAPN